MSGFTFQFWPTEYRQITQRFGVNPQNYAQFGLPGHEGLDIRAPSGSKVFCVAPGVVHQVTARPTGHNYGIHVRINHQDGYQTTYAHLQEALVRKGEQVEAGSLLGLADNTGNSFGSHLHLTLKKAGARQGNWPNNIIDPTPFILPLLGWQEPAGPYLNGWVLAKAISQVGDLAQANPGGATLRSDNNPNILIPEGTILIVTGREREGSTPVRVSRAAVGLDDHNLPRTPAPSPPPTASTLNGWAWGEYLNITGEQAIINTRQGANLRAKPDKDSTNIGVVRTGSTVTILARATHGYYPVRVRRTDFVGPVNLPLAPPAVPDRFLDHLPENIYLGWAQTQYLQLSGAYAYTRHSGVNIHSQPSSQGQYVGTIKGDATITVAGPAQATYTPVLANQSDLYRLASPLPEIERPQPFPDNRTPTMPFPHPPHQSIPGWIWTNDLSVEGDLGVTGPHGATVREAPRRNGPNIGYLPPALTLIVTGLASGEFTPVRVDARLAQPPIDDSYRDPNEAYRHPDPGPLGQARIGLHASADPRIDEAEIQEFADLRPGVIKVLSFHNAQDIARLAKQHPYAAWIVRAFLSFGDRRIPPEQFLGATLSDMKRVLQQLSGKNAIVELHNEPNVVTDGLGSSWADGAAFNRWWLELLDLYRQALPGVRFLFPGLSPGSNVTGFKHDHIQFIEACREAVEAADGLGIHLYWSNVYPLERALDVLDDYISRFRFKPIWISEASNNKTGTPVARKAQQYLQLWHALQQRPVVQGITYFVASASDPKFAAEVWVGRGIGKLVGLR